MDVATVVLELVAIFVAWAIGYRFGRRRGRQDQLKNFPDELAREWAAKVTAK